jgi:hypothetical protein
VRYKGKRKRDREKEKERRGVLKEFPLHALYPRFLSFFFLGLFNSMIGSI